MFTDREKEVMRLLKKGLTNPEIAAALSISRYTVNAHLSNMRKKARVRNRTQLVQVKTC